jgi:gas vesicle protein
MIRKVLILKSYSGRNEMQILLKGFFVGSILVGLSTLVYADDASKQVQMLNSQLQVQLKALQKSQQTQIQTLNKQLQTQLKTMQSTLEAQITDLNNKTEAKMKSLEASLEAQIKQVHEEVLTGGQSAVTSGASKKPSNEAPSTVTDGTTGNTSSPTETAPVGLQ